MDIYLYFLICTGIAVLLLLLSTVRSMFIPGARKMRRRLRDQGNEDDYGPQGLEAVVRRLLPEQLYERLEVYLIRNGQSYDWTPAKAIRSLTVNSCIGLFFSGILVLLYFSIPDAPVALILVAVFTLPVFPIIPILNFKMGRNSYITKIMYQTPEFLDILETDLVLGTGNVETAINRARKELDGELRAIVERAYLHLQRTPGDYPGAGEIIKNHIQTPLYDQITQLLSQYQLTGRAKRNIDALQRTCRTEVASIVKKQTQKKNLFITMVTMGLLVNLIILIGVPILFHMVDVQLGFIVE